MKTFSLLDVLNRIPTLPGKEFKIYTFCMPCNKVMPCTIYETGSIYRQSRPVRCWKCKAEGGALFADTNPNDFVFPIAVGRPEILYLTFENKELELREYFTKSSRGIFATEEELYIGIQNYFIL